MREIITEYETEEVEKTKTVTEYETVEKEREVIISDLTGEEIDPDEHVELHVNPRLEVELNNIDAYDMHSNLTDVHRSIMGRGSRGTRSRIRQTIRNMSFLVSDATIDVAESEIPDYDRGKNVTQPELEESDEGMKWSGDAIAKVFFTISIITCLYISLTSNDLMMVYAFNTAAIAAAIALLQLYKP